MVLFGGGFCVLRTVMYQFFRISSLLVIVSGGAKLNSFTHPIPGSSILLMYYISRFPRGTLDKHFPRYKYLET